MRSLHLMVAVLALAAAGRARAQSVDDLPSGARVRITVPDSVRQAPLTPRSRTVIGTMARATTDTLWLHVAGPDTVRVPRSALRRIYVSRGVSRSRSAVEQGLFMASIGLSLGVAANDGELRRESIGIGAVVAALGAFMGALSPYEHWQKVR